MIAKIFKNKLSLLAFLVLSTVLFAGKSFAASGIQISPLTFEYALKPGEQVSGVFTVKNTSDKELNYLIETENFNQINEEGAADLSNSIEANKIPNSLANWIVFEGEKSGKLAAGASDKRNFTVTIPADASPGGHYTAIFAKDNNAKDPNAQVTMVNRVGALMFVSIDGAISKTGTIKDLAFTSPVYQIGTNDFSFKFSNTGNVFYKSQGKIELTNLLGKTETVDMGSHLVIHNNSRNYTGTWSNKFPLGRYIVKAIALDGDGKEVTMTGVLWAFPWQLVVPIVLILVAIIIMIVALAKRGKKDNGQQNQFDIPQAPPANPAVPPTPDQASTDSNNQSNDTFLN